MAAPYKNQPVQYTVYKCVRCPKARSFDMLQLPKSVKSAKRSLEYHVATVHTDHTGDYKELIGETIVRSRNQRNGLKRAAATEVSTTDTEIALAQSIMKPAPKSVLEYQESANHARTKVAAIYQKLNDDKVGEAVIVGMDRWDQDALEGRIDEDIHKLAELAFPEDMFDRQFTVCSVLDEDILQHLASYYVEKATRFEDQTA